MIVFRIQYRIAGNRRSGTAGFLAENLGICIVEIVSKIYPEED
jgi:hypothetical protein